MISHVMVIGEIDDVLSDNTRYIKVQRPYRNAQGVFSEDKFPIQYWSKATNNYFMNMRNGTLIAIKGRLEFLEPFGMMIVCDFLESLHLPLTK